MTRVVNYIRKEPALVAGAVQAVIAALVAFGLPLDDRQVAAVLGVSAAVLALIVRSQVTPAANAAEVPHDYVDVEG